MARQAQRRAETRGKIIKAARALFAEHSFEQVSVSQIVEAADVAKGTFYKYYDTKVDVLADVYRDDNVNRNKQLLAEVEQGRPALPVLMDYMRYLCRWFEENQNVAEAVVWAGFRRTQEEVAESPEFYTRTFLITLMQQARSQGALRTDIPLDVMSIQLNGAMISNVLYWARNPVPGALVEAMEHSITIFLEGAGNEPTSTDMA